VFEPEHEVIRGQRLTVRPPHPFAQVEDERAAIILELVATGHIWADLLAGEVPEQETVRTGDGAVAVPAITGAGKAAVPGAAVAADLVDRLDDQRLPGQALLAGRHPALFHPACQ